MMQARGNACVFAISEVYEVDHGQSRVALEVSSNEWSPIGREPPFFEFAPASLAKSARQCQKTDNEYHGDYEDLPIDKTQ